MAIKTGNGEFYEYDIISDLRGQYGSFRVVKMVDTEFKDDRGTWWELCFEDVETATTNTFDDYIDKRDELKEKYGIK